MKRMSLVLAWLLPLAAAAQAPPSISVVPRPTDLGATTPTMYSPAGTSNLFDPSSAVKYALGVSSGVPGAEKKKAPPPAAERQESQRPRTEGSMVGYIDDAIVGSQVRIRFDAGFNDDTPDLAEFFYGKCGCYRGLANVAPAAYDPNAPGPPPGNAIVIPRTLNFQQVFITTEYAFSRRISVFADLPFRWLQAQGLAVGTPGSFPNQGGFSDARVGVKVAVLASANHYLTAQFRTYAPSGDASKGLGTNHWSIEPAVLYYQKLSGRAALESQFSFWHPTSGSAGVPTSSSRPFWGNILIYGFGPSYVVYRNDRFRVAPVVEIVGWHILGGMVTGAANPDATGINIVNGKIGIRTGFGRRSSIYAGFGHKLTKEDWYQDIFRVEYRYSF